MHPALLHFSDSALPVGAYAHSFGLEGMCQDGAVHDEESLDQFLRRDVRHALTRVELPLVVRAHRAGLDCQSEDVLHWDQFSRALRPTRQLRDAASQIGRGQWRVYQQTWGSNSQNGARASWFDTFQSPVVSGVAFAELGVSLEESMTSVLYQTFSALTQAALKLLPLGPTATQRLLTAALQETVPELPQVLALPDSELGTFNPLWDIAASRHERAPARLFLS